MLRRPPGPKARFATCWLCDVGGFLLALGFRFHVFKQGIVIFLCLGVCQAEFVLFFVVANASQSVRSSVLVRPKGQIVTLSSSASSPAVRLLLEEQQTCEEWASAQLHSL